MMLPVLSSQSFVYHYVLKLAVVRVYRRSYHVSDDSKITSNIVTTVDYILGQQQGFACDGIQMTRTTAQVASFESPPCYTVVYMHRICVKYQYMLVEQCALMHVFQKRPGCALVMCAN